MPFTWPQTCQEEDVVFASTCLAASKTRKRLERTRCLIYTIAYLHVYMVNKFIRLACFSLSLLASDLMI